MLSRVVLYERLKEVNLQTALDGDTVSGMFHVVCKNGKEVSIQPAHTYMRVNNVRYRSEDDPGLSQLCRTKVNELSK